MATENSSEKFVKIGSMETLIVTPNLDYLNRTDNNPANPNKLKVIPTWTRKEVKILKGFNWYPAKILEWNTVQALIKSGKINVGEVTTDINKKANGEEAVEISKQLKRADKEIDRQKKTFEQARATKQKSLSEIAAAQTTQA